MLKETPERSGLTLEKGVLRTHEEAVSLDFETEGPCRHSQRGAAGQTAGGPLSSSDRGSQLAAPASRTNTTPGRGDSDPRKIAMAHGKFGK